MVVLAGSGGTEHRLRKLPARVVVYVLLAADLFEQIGYLAVWRKLTGSLEGLPVPKVTATALWHARTRLGSRPLQALFDLLRGPAAAPGAAGARWAGMLVCAIDGTCLDVPDSARCRAWCPKGANQYATAGYPQIRLTALVACGTRAIIDAAFGPCTRGETVYGQQLMRCLHANMIVLLDRGFASNAFLEAVAGTSADFLARLSAARRPPVLHRYRDGSFLSQIGQVKVRIIECEITITTATGRQTGIYRLATTLLNPDRHPAFELVRLYHERWEIESAYFEIKKRCWAAASCAPAPRPASPRRYTRYWPSIRSSGSRSLTPPAPPPAPTRTGPASPSPSKQPGTRSSRLRTSSPPPGSTWPAPSAERSWTT